MGNSRNLRRQEEDAAARNRRRPGEDAAAYAARCRSRRPGETEKDHTDRLAKMDRNLKNKRASRSQVTASGDTTVVRVVGDKSVTDKSVTDAQSDTRDDTHPSDGSDDTFYGHINTTKPSTYCDVKNKIQPSVTGDTLDDTRLVSLGEGGERTSFSPPSPGTSGADTQKKDRVSPAADDKNDDRVTALGARVGVLEKLLFEAISKLSVLEANAPNASAERVSPIPVVSPVTLVAPSIAPTSVTATPAEPSAQSGEPAASLVAHEPTLQEVLSKGFRCLLADGRGEDPRRILEPLDGQDDVYLDETYRQAERMAAAKRGVAAAEGDSLSLWCHWVLRFVNEYEDGPRTPSSFALNIHEYAAHFGLTESMRRWSRASICGLWERRIEQISAETSSLAGDGADVG